MINTIIFDYGNVISLNTEKVNPIAGMAKAFGVEGVEIKNAIGEHIHLLRTGKVSEFEFWQLMAKSLSSKVPKNWQMLWKTPFSKVFRVDKDMLEYVSSLKNKGVKIAVLSNNIMPYVEVIRNAGGFEGFDLVLNSCEVGLAKPEPEIYKLALNKLDSKPEEILFLDDREENLIPAQALGMKVFLATDRQSVLDAITKHIS